VQIAGSMILRARHHILVDVAVAALVLALPLSLRGATTAASASDAQPVAALSLSAVEAPRASTVSRGATITPVTDPTTAVADDVRPIVHYTLGPADDLQKLSNFFHVSAEAIAYSNGISDPDLRNQRGREILIPPGEGALYTVKDGDTVGSVAAQFKVEPKAIEAYNRLYFEPEHFAKGQLVFVPGATVPGLTYITTDGEADAPPVTPAIARPGPAAPSNTGRLAWPVAGVITQYFWAYHTGVDLAAPYGTGIGASESGTVVYAGWVAVGGLSVRIQHANGMETGYYHMSATFVTAGTKVDKGQIVGTVGMTGATTGPHVHWELKLKGQFVNPLAY
jgi:murein DD-endopeptidase MepM/ murein hydrolase activator NlpD